MSNRRIIRINNLALLIAVVSMLVVSVSVAACGSSQADGIPDRVTTATPAPAPDALDLTRLGTCLDRSLRPVQDGSMSVYGYPCVWDSFSMGTVTGQETVRWVLYVDGQPCPETVQPATDVKCIDVMAR